MKRQGAFFYILILVPVAVVALLIIFVLPTRQPETAEVVLPSPQVGEPTEPQAPPVYDKLIDVTPETVQTVIGTLARADSYSRTLTETLFWDGGSRVSTLAVSKDMENVRITVSSPETPTKNVLISGGEKWIWYSDSAGVYHGAASEDDADAYQALLGYEKVTDISQSDITDAGYTDFGGEDCIYVRYRSGALGYVSALYVSVDTGLVMGDETYDGEKLVYSMTSSPVDVSTPEAEHFTVPEEPS